MSTDGENAKNQTSEIEDTKPNLDSTDSSQESASDVLNKSDDKETVNDKKDENDDGDKKEKSEKSSEDEKSAGNEKAAVNDNVKEEKEKVDSKKNDNDEGKKNDKDAKEKKNEDKTDDDTEGGEDAEEGSADDDDDEEDDDKKDVPLLDQPLEKSGPRERKKVQRFTEEFTAEQKEGAKVDLPEGNGVQLGEIPRIDASISRFKTEDLKLLHRLLFKTPGKTVQIKKNIRKFNGFEFEKDSDAYTKKIASTQKFEMKQLKSICEMLDLDKKGNKEELADRICEFLLEPKDSGKPAGGGRPKRSAATRANNRGYSSADDDDDDSDGGKRSSRSTRGKGRRVNLKDDSSSDEEFNPSNSEEERPRAKRGRGRSSVGAKKKPETDEEISDVEETPSDEDSDEPKSKKKRGPVAKVQNNKVIKKPVVAAKSPRGPGRKPANSTPAKNKKAEPAKRGRKKKQQPESEEDEEKDSEENNAGSSSEDEPLVKKSKSPQPPTDEEIKTYVKEILEGANLEEITMKTVCKQVYAHYPEFDLAHKKDFIKTTVKSLIST